MAARISVIIPTHYRNTLLARAITSVQNQSYDPVELIVVDDSGEAHARPVLERFPDVTPIYHEENRGWAAANTTGIEASSGEYIQLLDDDDYLFEGKLAKTAAILDANPDIGVSYCGVIRGEDGPCFPKSTVAGNILKPALRFETFPLWTGSMLIRRDVLLDCLPLAGMAPDDDLDIELGDTDLKIELAIRAQFEYVDECLAVYSQTTNALWTEPRTFQKVRQNVEHRGDLYDQYPEIKHELLATWYRREGKYWLKQRTWALRAIWCFSKSTYHARGLSDRMKGGAVTLASMFGLPGWLAINHAWEFARRTSQG